jgi:homoserine kinase
MTTDTIIAFAPATVANVGPGFDIMGFALSGPGDEVLASWSDAPGVTIAHISGDGGKLPVDAERNCIGVVAAALLAERGITRGVRLTLTKGLPLGSGMGSSAASSAAAALAVNTLIGSPFPPRELVRFAMIGEERACGAAHADNVAPALLGGFVLVASYEPLTFVELPCPSSLFYAVINPDFVLETAVSRSVLPREVPLATTIKQSAALARLLCGLYQDNHELITSSLVDYLAEPVRLPLIPGSDTVKRAAIDAGGYNCTISGSGPSLFSLCPSLEVAEQVGHAMKGAFATHAINATAHTGQIIRHPPRISIISPEIADS